MKEFRYYLDDYTVPEEPEITTREVSEEEMDINSDHSYDYDTDSSNDE